MRKTFKILILTCLLAVLIVSCERADIGVSMSEIQPFVTSSGQMGFSFYAYANLPSDDGNKIEIKSPSGRLSWNCELQAVTFDGAKYFGSSNFVMPPSANLENGSYSYLIVCKDGRTIEGTFSLRYQDKDGAIERSEGLKKPYFDTASNLTVLN